MNREWRDIAIWALTVVVLLVSWIGAQHIAADYHPGVAELVTGNLRTEHNWNEKRHDAAAADRREILERLAAIEILLHERLPKPE